MGNFYLNVMCRMCRGKLQDPGENAYFVCVEGECVLATTIFNAANNLFNELIASRKQSVVLADRRVGDLAVYYPSSGISLDARHFDYYEQQRLGLTDKQFAEAKAQRDAYVAAAKEAARVDKPGEWIVKHGKTEDVYFYVQRVQRNGKLVGTTVFFSHGGKYRGERTTDVIYPENFHEWKTVYIETVRGLGLERFI